MLELLSPAGSPEAVVAAVQSGADTIYIGFGLTGTERSEQGFSPEEFAQALRYCRVRGCRAVFALGDVCTDATVQKAVERALFAAENGCDAIMLRDLGLARVLRSLLPDMPLWGDVTLGIHSLDGALAAAALGFSRVVLAPELSRDQIARIAGQAPLETIVYVHGHLCFAHAGQCFMSALADPSASANLGRCSDPCRRRFSLGGRMDDHPLSMREVCLLDHLDELAAAGVCCAAIEGHSRRPEYIAYATRVYARAIHEHIPPSAEERSWLGEALSTNGVTDAFFTGDKDASVFGVAGEPDRDARRLFAEVRRGYMKGELRRIPLKFYVVMQPGQQALFAAEDNRGNRAVCKGFVPVDLGRAGIGEERVRDLLYRTGGTPYICREVSCSLAERMDYPEEAVEAARRELIAKITEAGRYPRKYQRGELPPPPAARMRTERPKLIFQVSLAEQLTEALAAFAPELLYVPAELIAAGEPRLELFRAQGTELAAVLPRVVTDGELTAFTELLNSLRRKGVRQVLGGSLGFLRLIRELGLELRGDYGLNAANSYTLEELARAGLRSATVSFELSAAQIRELAKPLDCEMIVYGRLPALVSDHCIIRSSAGRCTCDKPAGLQDENGGVWPVLREPGCRSAVYAAEKVYLADKSEKYTEAGLWGARLLFTSESPRECAEVARRYRAGEGAPPNNAGRGLYVRGAL